jgi:undecaprenyl-diphosphatase
MLQQNISSISSRLKLLSIDLIIVLIAFFSAVFVVIFLVKEVFFEKTAQWDEQVFSFWSKYVSTSTTHLMQVFTFFGSPYFLIPANLLLIAYSLFIKRDHWFAIKTASVALSSLVLMFALKLLFNRPRPLLPLLGEVPGLSFPSGHSFMSFSFFGLLIFMVNNKVSNVPIRYLLIFIFLVMILMVGTSRIYLRLHFATDVLAGFALGIIWLILSLFALHIIENHQTKLPAVP